MSITRNTLVNLLCPMMIAGLLSGCGSTEADLNNGSDFSDSPLRVSTLAPIRQILLFWSEVDGATHYRLFEDPDGDSNNDGEMEFVQLGADIPAGTLQFARDVSVHLYNWKKARFMLQSCVDAVCTQIGQQEVDGLSAPSIGRFFPATNGFDAAFGFSIAVAEQGNRVAAGAIGTSVFACEEIFPVEVIPGETVLQECEYDASLTDEEVAELMLTRIVIDAGGVSIFSIVDGVWEVESFLDAPNMESGDLFGTAVALSDDGNTLAVSATLEDSSATGIDGDMDNNDAISSGAVYIFQRAIEDDEPVWNFQAYLKASNTDGDPDPDDTLAEGDLFGSAIALSGDGLTLAVSAVQEDSDAIGIDGEQAGNAAKGSGAVYVFRQDMGAWTQQAYLKASNTGADDLFGASVAISDDGSRIAASAIGESSVASGINGDQFNDSAADSGAVYVFDWSGSAWSQTAYIKAQSPDARDEFGYSVAFNSDGNSLAVGAPQEDGNSFGVGGNQNNDGTTNTGAAYLFEFNDPDWSQTEYFKASNADDVDEMGIVVSLNNTGDILLATAIREGSNAVGINGEDSLDFSTASGAGYMFVKNAGAWKQKSYIKAAQNTFNLQFGWDAGFALDGDLLVISARGSGGVVFLY